VDATNVYWTARGAGTVYQAPIGGGAAITLASGQADPTGIVVDGPNVYFLDNFTPALFRVPVGGGPLVMMASNLGNPYTLVQDAKALYWDTPTAIYKLAK
jgi:hypothetical protein